MTTKPADASDTPRTDAAYRKYQGLVRANIATGDLLNVSRRLERSHAELVEFVEDLAGNDCYEYDKYLNPKPCGKCLSCRARAAIANAEKVGK